ncbi:MAG: hypothetical protein GEV04_23665 [Actinophytocola sp.]|nr:hypothetical protein [Actinophytocola sp.]
MSEPVHKTVRYESATGSATGTSPEASLHIDKRDSASHSAMAGQDTDINQEAHEDAYRDDQWSDSDDSAGRGQSDVPTEAVDDTAEFVLPAPAEENRSSSRLGLASDRFAASPHVAGIWIGFVLAAAGFGAIYFTWTNVAALTNVAQQMPYLVSGGISGLVLIIAGATVVDITVRRRDSKERTEQLAQMTRALAEVRELLESEQHQSEAD